MRLERCGVVAPSAWLLGGQLQKMVLVVTSATSKEVLERWSFDVITDREAAAGQCAACTLHPDAP